MFGFVTLHDLAGTGSDNVNPSFFLLVTWSWASVRASKRGAGGTMAPGPMVFRGHMRRPNGLHRAHRNETPKTFFFWRSPEFRQTNRFNSGEDLFFFWDHLKIRRKVSHFPCLFWTAQNQRCVIFELSPGLPSALGAPAFCYSCCILEL